MSLGSQLKKYRQAAEIGYPEMAEFSGVEVGTLNALEKRGSNRSNHFMAIAKAFGLTLEELADEHTDHSEQVRQHIALKRKYPTLAVDPTNPAHTAREATPPAWDGEYWPFAIPKDRARETLEPGDIERISAYIAAIVEMRESEPKKNAA